jgi:hypothetical protein
MYPPQGTDQPALHRLRHFHSKKSHELPKAGKKRQNLKKDFATTSLKICLYIQTPRGLHIFLQGKRKKAGLLTRSLRVLPFPALM